MSGEWIIQITSRYWPMFLRGAALTLMIALISTVLGFVIGLLVGVVRTLPISEKKNLKWFFQKLASGILYAYIEIFRATPMMVQAMVIFYGSALMGWHMDRIYAAMFIVSINTGAYMAEIMRGGIVSVDKGQFEAAHAIGMNHIKTMIYVVLPQAIRNILPATGNEFIINIKDTAVLSVISVSELFFQTLSVAGNNFRYFEAFFVAGVLYFIMTYSVTLILRYLEKRLDGPENYKIYTNRKVGDHEVRL